MLQCMTRSHKGDDMDYTKEELEEFDESYREAKALEEEWELFNKLTLEQLFYMMDVYFQKENEEYGFEP